MKFRVVRIMEYTYSDAELMVKDMSHWQVGANSCKQFGDSTSTMIRSAILLPETLFPEAPSDGKDQSGD